jgi:hypothetical protein
VINKYPPMYLFFWIFPRRQLWSLWRWNWQRVPKRRQITIWRRGNNQKNKYIIQNTAKVWNQEIPTSLKTLRVSYFSAGVHEDWGYELGETVHLADIHVTNSKQRSYSSETVSRSFSRGSFRSYRTRSFICLFTRTQHWILSSASRN